MIEFHPEAIREARAARRWYKQKDPALSEAFQQELDHAVDQIEKGPHRWHPFDHGTRRFLMHRFPYSVIYLDSDPAIVVAVAHHRRKPGYWKGRL